MKRNPRLRCPECGSLSTTVVCSKESMDGERVRRRLCKNCNHRFYTEQGRESVLEPWQVNWLGRDLQVHRRAA